MKPLVAILRKAYSGELAAALAYKGHAASLQDAEERSHLLKIEREELDHRDFLGDLLHRFGTRPDPARERRARWIGTVLGLLCRYAGWFLPMYAAGRLESRNVGEYETAARLALESGEVDLVVPLLKMAETEAEHERFFRMKSSRGYSTASVKRQTLTE